MSIDARSKDQLLEPQISTLRESFNTEYERNGFLDCDPVIAKLLTAKRPFLWSNMRAPANERDKTLLEFLRSFGVIRGVVVPLPHRPGRISAANISTDGDTKFDAETVHCLSIIATAAMIKAEALGLCADDHAARLGEADLSPRQIEVLHWAAQGKSNTDIATIIGQSRRAVDYHMSEILRKLRVTSRNQAIAAFSAAESSATLSTDKVNDFRSSKPR